MRSPTPPPKTVSRSGASSSSSSAARFPPPPPGHVHHIVVSRVGPDILRDQELMSAALRGMHYLKQGDRHILDRTAFGFRTDESCEICPQLIRDELLDFHSTLFPQSQGHIMALWSPAYAKLKGKQKSHCDKQICIRTLYSLTEDAPPLP